MGEMDDRHSASSPANGNKKHESSKFFSSSCKGDGSVVVTGELWKDGLICAFEFVRGNRWMSSRTPAGATMQRRVGHGSRRQAARSLSADVPDHCLQGDGLVETQHLIDFDSPGDLRNAAAREIVDSHWVPIGWSRVSELAQATEKDARWASQQVELAEEEDDLTVADVAAPYWERPEGPTWWCHVDPTHRFVESWLSGAQWLHPAISIALRDENRLISERMRHLLYEVPVRVAGGLLFELLGQSVGDPCREEDDIPIVLRSWQCQNFLISALHVKGSATNVNVLGITEVQELLLVDGSSAPKSIHEVIAHLACRLSRWDDRLFRKYVFGAADELELKFVNRRSHEDLNLLVIILNQEIKRLATQAIRVKWSLHAREEIVFELLRHSKGHAAKLLLEGIKDSTREMLQDQEAVRGRLFTVQDVMQSAVRAWLQDRSLRVSHNLGIFGGCGLVLSILTGLFGINVDGIPGSQRTPYAFLLFAGILCLVGGILVGLGMLYLGLQRPITDELVNVRKLELQQLVSVFQQDAEQHAKVRQGGGASRHGVRPPPPPPPMSPAAALADADYVLIA